jgi:hypothetical protein
MPANNAIGGRLVVVGLLGSALLLAGFGVWHHYMASRRAMDLWGPEAAGLISRAAQVEILRLGAQGDDAESTIDIRGQLLPVEEMKDISRAPGLVHVRAALVEDASFDWEDSSQAAPQWRHALRFRDGGLEATVVFAWNVGAAKRAGGRQSVSIAPLAQALQRFCEEQFAESQNSK